MTFLSLCAAWNEHFAFFLISEMSHTRLRIIWSSKPKSGYTRLWLNQSWCMVVRHRRWTKVMQIRSTSSNRSLRWVFKVSEHTSNDRHSLAPLYSQMFHANPQKVYIIWKLMNYRLWMYLYIYYNKRNLRFSKYSTLFHKVQWLTNQFHFQSDLSRRAQSTLLCLLDTFL